MTGDMRFRPVLTATLMIVCIAEWIAGGPAWGQSKNKSTPPRKPAYSKGTETHEPQRGSKDAPIFVHFQQDPHGQETATSAQNKSTGKDFYDKLGAWAGAAVALFTLILVGVGYCGVKAALRTLKAIETQGQHMERQVALMELPFKQWVELHNWKADLRLGENALRIRVDVVNQTSFPMMLKSGSVKFSRREVGDNQLLITEHFLPPKVPYTIDMNVLLGDEQASQFNTQGLLFDVDGNFVFLGALNEIDKDRPAFRQEIRGHFGCTPKKKWFQAIIPMTPVAVSDEQQA